MDQKYCLHCKHTLPVTDFVQLKSGKPYSYCKPCHIQKNRDYYLQNQEKHLAYRRDYRARNREKLLEQDRAGRTQRTLEVLRHYGNGTASCACCNESCVEMLQLDHIDANGADHRKFLKQEGVGGYATGWFIYKWLIDNNFPEGYQVLCASCNIGKHRSKVNICPHEIARQELTQATSAHQAP
jgi:hypothetical protein